MSEIDERYIDGCNTSRRAFLGASAAATGIVAAGRWLTVGAVQGAERVNRKAKTGETARQPTDPLSAEEIERAVAKIRKEKSLGDNWRFVSVALAEPSRPVTDDRPAGPLVRTAEVLAIDSAAGQAVKALVELVTGKVTSYEAGVDIISSTYSLASTAEAFNDIVSAVQDGTISKQRIDDRCGAFSCSSCSTAFSPCPTGRR